jgi:tetratricopeptide (TPR) repeat protein
METSPELSSYEDRTLYSTWQISFDNIKQRNPLSANLLRLWAYFDNQDLWFELLQHGESDNPKWLRELTKDELSFDGAVRVLSNHGLVEVAASSQESIESKGYSIHGCVHSWTIHALNQEWDYDLARLAVKFVGAHVPREKDSKPWMMQRRLLQHAARCSYMFSNSLVVEGELADDCHNLGYLYAEHSKLVEAEQMYQRALQGKEKAWGLDHTSTLDTVNNLAALYADQGKLVEAEQMYQRALQGYEKAIGPDLISTYVPALNTTFNLGLLVERQADIATARTMFSKALRGYEQVFGPDYAKSETVRNKLCALDAMLENKAPVEIEELTDDLLTGSSHPGINKPPSTSKRTSCFESLA